MKKTRNLFVLQGQVNDVSKALSELQFKGLTVLKSKPLKQYDVNEVFSHNKSVVCANCYSKYFYWINTIFIDVGNGPSDHDDYLDISNGDIVSQFAKIADNHDCDIGDAKSNDSGINGVPSIKDCAYCQHSNTERTVYESENFYSFPTLGEFIAGYLLIIPKKHVTSIAALDSSLYQEFTEVLNDCIYLLKLTYHTDKFLIWENGTGNSGKGKAKDSIVHAHVHIAPSNLNIQEIESISGFSFQKISTMELTKYDKHSYLLINGGNDTWYINNNPKLYIPRQYIRQLLAEENHLSGDLWNWRTNPCHDLIIKTANDILLASKQNFDNLPDRIANNTKKFL